MDDLEDKKNSKSKHLTFASGMIYTILSPVLVMYIIYVLIEKYYLKKSSMPLLIFCIFFGIFSGYWSLFKQIWRIK